MTDLVCPTTPSRSRAIAYWITTALVAAESAVSGVMEIPRLSPFIEVMTRLGYPAYFSVILGVWKVLAVAAILVPRFPRLKEWAYAGLFFNMTGAVASHFAVGDAPTMLVAPTIFAGLVIASGALRPPARRDFAPG